MQRTAVTIIVHVCKGMGQELPTEHQSRLMAATAGIVLTLACSQQVHPQPELQGQGIAERRVAPRSCSSAQLLLQRIAVPEERGSQGPACPPGAGSGDLGLRTGQAAPRLPRAGRGGASHGGRGGPCQLLDVLAPAPEGSTLHTGLSAGAQQRHRWMAGTRDVCPAPARNCALLDCNPAEATRAPQDLGKHTDGCAMVEKHRPDSDAKQHGVTS